MNLIRMVCLAVVAMALAGAGPGGGDAAKARRLMNAGVARARLGQQQDALTDFMAALDLKTLSAADQVRATFDCGVALDALGRSDEAIAAYSQALRLDPKFAPALSNRANAYRRLGKFPEAKRDYLAALAAGDAAREYPYYGLAQIAEKQGDFDGARDYYAKALAANPAFVLAVQGLTALNHATRDPIVLRPPDARPPLGVHPQGEAAATPTAFVHYLAPAKPVVPGAAGPPLRLAIIDAAPSTAPPRALVQLGAFGDQAGAAAGWNKIAAASEGALQGLSPLVIPVDLPGKGRLWRLRTAVGDKSGALRLCAALAAKGLACIPVRD